MTRSTNRGLLIAQIAIVGLLFVVVALMPGNWNVLRITGITLMLAGAILLFIARIQLGDSFSVTAQARRLVIHGLYSRIRNPIYVFSALFFLGFALAAGFPRLLW